MSRSALAGKRVVNTRAAHQAAALDDLLRAREAEPLPYPCIAIAPPEDTRPLDAGLKALAAGQVDWLVLTSENTVLALAERLRALGIAPAALASARLAAVGPQTAAAASEHLGLSASLIPDDHVAEALAGALKGQGGGRVFLPQSNIARAVLANELAAAGFDVNAMAAYRTVVGTGGADVPTLLRERAVDGVVFTSASTAHNFADRLRREGGTLSDMQGVCVACIGPVTAAAVRQYGLTPDIVPTTYTLEGIVDAMEKVYASQQTESP